MNSTRKLILVFFPIFYFIFYCTCLGTPVDYNNLNSKYLKSNIGAENSTIAINDTFEFIIGCNNSVLSECVITNDIIPNNSNSKVCNIYAPNAGTLSFGTGGKFLFTIEGDFTGEVTFRYRLCDDNSSNNFSEAEVIINVKKDNDCDNITDDEDLDDDNDGILDFDEGEGLIDTDADGFPDNFDIDSDNDGITDIVEWQTEGFYKEPSGLDSNKNGWDDAFDSSVGGNYYEQADTDNNGTADYLDTDSDSDGIPDYIEGNDINFDGIPEFASINSDSDGDGLDDTFDTIVKGADAYNSYGSSSPLPDENSNGIRDWREAKIKGLPGIDNPINEFIPDVYIYPNPSNGNFSINIPLSTKKEEIRIKIYNLNGILLLEKLISQTNYVINAEHLQSGIYIVRLQSPTLEYTERLRIIK